MTAPPVESALLVRQGTTQTFRWFVSDPDNPETGIDLTIGYAARMAVREWFTFPALAEFSSPDDGIVLGADGYLTLTFTATESTAWGWSSAVYDIELTGPSGPVRLAFGPIVVSPEVTLEA